MKTTVRGTNDGGTRYFVLVTPVCVIYDDDLNISVEAILPTYFKGKYNNISISFGLIEIFCDFSNFKTRKCCTFCLDSEVRDDVLPRIH